MRATRDVLEGRCAICKKRARRLGPVNETNRFQIDCPACGKYQVGGMREARMLVLPTAGDLQWVPRIHEANARGYRYCLGSEEEIPLAPFLLETGGAEIPSASVSRRSGKTVVKRVAKPRSRERHLGWIRPHGAA